MGLQENEGKTTKKTVNSYSLLSIRDIKVKTFIQDTSIGRHICFYVFLQTY